jgi:DNA polymerase III subunit delta'
VQAFFQFSFPKKLVSCNGIFEQKIMLFSEVVGQEDVKKRLIQSVQEDRISHAQLFLGPEGSGNLALAVAYAQYINCANRLPDDSCGVCPSCNKFGKLIHPDLHFAFPVASSSKDPVSDDFIKEWRALFISNPYFNANQWYAAIGLENKQGLISKNESHEILRKLNLKTFEADYKVMIIWMPEKMNPTAANKLLKILEEPPLKTLFLLVVENSGLMLSTILSRTQLIKVPKIEEAALYPYILSKYTYPENQVKDAVRISNGNLNVALRVLQSDEENIENFDLFTLLMRTCYKKDVLALMDWCDKVCAYGRERQKNFLQYAVRLLRENYLLNKGVPQLAMMTSGEQDFSNKFHLFINDQNIQPIFSEMEKAMYHVESNGNDKLIFTDMALKLIKLIRANG